ncbi:SpaH/EbpB family LPXTG-anchored major pilin [Serinibacter arcticus]|nr:SpaH/EbpB family LPXTG-anchored major pilin [Serinibacter arcticus]
MNRSTPRGVVRRAAAALGAVGLVLLGAVALTTPAAAAPGNLPTADGSLTIHKFQQPTPANTEPGDGSPITPPAGWVPLGGVQFQIQEITDVDLTTNVGWDLAASYGADPSTIPGASLTTVTTVTSAASGTTPTQTLPIGAYLVTELPSPAATLPDGSPANIVVTAAPFVVTVPIPDGAGEWNSAVNVYPKNSVTSAEKTAGVPSASGLGSTVTWTVTVDIPALAAGATFDDVAVTDALDPRLEFVPGSVTTSISTTPATSPAFTVTHPGGLGGLLDIEITDLAQLTAAQNEVLTVTFDTIVRGIGEIPNTATAYINDAARTNGIPTNTPITEWAAVEIVKHAAGDLTNTLAGAVFTVHLTEADAETGANPISVDGVTEFTSVDPTGVATVAGLAAGDYWLREATAPVGYDLSPDLPLAFAVEVVDGDAVVNLTVGNPQKPAIDLPITGGQGTVALLVAGGLLLATGTGVAIVAARRRQRGTDA